MTGWMSNPQPAEPDGWEQWFADPKDFRGLEFDVNSEEWRVAEENYATYGGITAADKLRKLLEDL